MEKKKKTQRHASALKAARQSLKRRARNLETRKKFKGLVKSIRKMAATGKAADQKKLGELLNQAQKQLMRAASKKVIRKGAASRYVARLSKTIHRATA